MTISSSAIKGAASAALKLGRVAHKRPLSSPHLYCIDPQICIKKNKENIIFAFSSSHKQLVPKCKNYLWPLREAGTPVMMTAIREVTYFSLRMVGVIPPIK